MKNQMCQDQEDITIEDGTTWQFYHKCEPTIEGYYYGIGVYMRAQSLYGNVLLVRRKEEVLIYVPKS